MRTVSAQSTTRLKADRMVDEMTGGMGLTASRTEIGRVMAAVRPKQNQKSSRTNEIDPAVVTITLSVNRIQAAKTTKPSPPPLKTTKVMKKTNKEDERSGFKLCRIDEQGRGKI
ncbi:hypothetical protein Q3G72_023790 [Acer saccharum]|nr:hypothetical protein Q3G72_023790 [Acer saccharum]